MATTIAPVVGPFSVKSAAVSSSAMCRTTIPLRESVPTSTAACLVPSGSTTVIDRAPATAGWSVTMIPPAWATTAVANDVPESRSTRRATVES